jgi:hypothetical protein
MPKASTTAAASASASPPDARSSSTPATRRGKSKAGNARPSSSRQTAPKTGTAPKAGTDSKAATAPALFKYRVFLPGEDPAYWRALYEGIREAVKPIDMLDEFWARNMADIAYDVMRYRAQRDVILINLRHEGLEDLLTGLAPAIRIQELSAQYRFQDAEADKGAPGTSVRESLKALGVTEEAITAATWLRRIDDVERIENLIMRAEARLLTLQRESHHRAEARKRLEEAIPRLIDATTEARITAAGTEASTDTDGMIGDGPGRQPHV